MSSSISIGTTRRTRLGTDAEVRGWCEDCGLRITHMDVSDSGLSVLARRGP